MIADTPKTVPPTAQPTRNTAYYRRLCDHVVLCHFADIDFAPFASSVLTNGIATMM